MVAVEVWKVGEVIREEGESYVGEGRGGVM